MSTEVELRNALRDLVGDHCESHVTPLETCPTCVAIELLATTPGAAEGAGDRAGDRQNVIDETLISTELGAGALLELRDQLSDVAEDPKNLDVEYVYGAMDILAWLTFGRPAPDDRMGATNSRLHELLTQAGITKEKTDDATNH